jgi:hypothetical protein
MFPLFKIFLGIFSFYSLSGVNPAELESLSVILSTYYYYSLESPDEDTAVTFKSFEDV